MTNPFVHLHCHSHYSLLDGASKIPDLCKRVAALGMPAVAVTDHGNLHGALELIREAKSASILPIIGIEAYVSPFGRADHRAGGCSGKEHAFHLTLLAQSAEGFRNLIRLSSLAFLEGFYYKPRIDREILERHSAGLICLSGCVSSEFSDHLLYGKKSDAEKLAAWYARVFPGRFFVEIQCNGIQIQADHEPRATDLANRMGLPLAATSDAHYLHQSDAPSHDLLLCINTGRKAADRDRMRFDNDQFFVRSPAEMYAALPSHAEALARTAEIAATVEPYYESAGIGRRRFPSFATPAPHTPETYLRALCLAGLADRYPDDDGTARTRLDHELAIINKMGFASYMLIVWDFVNYARENGIPNSARGSACGAIVSYLLYLSHVDPLRYDLLFERFLDPSRSEAPDIDIDICKQRRIDVINYVRRRYGDANIAQIGTFGTMAARSSIKDVGRVLDVPLPKIESICKLIPTKAGTTLRGSLQADPNLAALARDNPDLFAHALRLEGTMRSVGTHAAGIVIADSPLMDMVPLQKPPKNSDLIDSINLTQWEMGDIEKAGLLKMDFLGLRNLTILDRATKLIRRTHPDFDPYRIPVDDAPTFAMLRRGESRGVFQLESQGIRDLLIRIAPTCVEDLIATVTLYRPGPMDSGMLDNYVECKHGRKPVEYIHPSMKDYLAETYGQMIYQESIMQVLNRLGGMELTRAYTCIKAISKKKLEDIKKFRAEFLAGSVANGLEPEKAEKVFSMVEFFSQYGFNRSHATAYAYLSYQTAYIKANHPAEFTASLLSSEMEGSERGKFFVDHIADARRMGLAIQPPDVNTGEPDFTIAPDGSIRFGLAAIKGVGRATFDAIARARPFASLDDFARRVGPDYLTKSVLEILIRSGALDTFGRRSQLLAVVDRLVSRLRSSRKAVPGLQTHFFTLVDGTAPEPPSTVLPDVPELPDAERLAAEKEALGFYVSGHPLDKFRSLLDAFTSHGPDDTLPPDKTIIMGGVLTGVECKSFGSSRLTKATLETPDGPVPVVSWNADALAENWSGFVVGRASYKRDPPDLIVDRLVPVSDYPSLARFVIVRADRSVLPIAARHSGNTPLVLDVPGSGIERVPVNVRLDPAFYAAVREAHGPNSVHLMGARGSHPAPG